MSRLTGEFEVPSDEVLGWIADAGIEAGMHPGYVLRMQAEVVDAGRCAVGTFSGAQTGGCMCPAGMADLHGVEELRDAVSEFARQFDKLADAHLAARSEDYVLYPVLVLI